MERKGVSFSSLSFVFFWGLIRHCLSCSVQLYAAAIGQLGARLDWGEGGATGIIALRAHKMGT